MRIYRYSYYRRRKTGKAKAKAKKSLVLLMLAGAALLFIFEGWGGGLAGVKKEFAAVCYKDLLGFYMPGLWYEDTQGSGIVSYLLDCFFPVGGNARTEPNGYPIQVESELSYEMILAREAADENYVDEETGEVVFAGSDGENADIASAEDAAVDTANSAAESAAGTGLAAAVGTGEKVKNISREKLRDFDYLVQNFYQIDSTTTINGSQLNVDALLGKDVRLSHDASQPQILIYHTHSQEAFVDSVPGDENSGILGAGEYLASILRERYGYNVLHHTACYDADRDYAYSNSLPEIEKLLRENPSIEVVIDLHRDAMPAERRLVMNLQGRPTAQFMFFNGLSRTKKGEISYLENPYLEENLAFSFQMQAACNEYYPGIARRIYLKAYRYNMHLCPKTLLIELGAQNNTEEEIHNACDPLAHVLHLVLSGKEPER